MVNDDTDEIGPEDTQTRVLREADVAVEKWAHESARWVDRYAPPNRRPYVLVAEDNEPLTVAYRRILDEHAEVRIVMTVAEALRAIAERVPDLLVLDEKFPNGSGVSIALAFRQVSNGKILLVSGVEPAITDHRYRDFQNLHSLYKGDAETIIRVIRESASSLVPVKPPNP